MGSKHLKKTKTESTNPLGLVKKSLLISVNHFILGQNIFIALCAVFFYLSGDILSSIKNIDYPSVSLIFWSALLIYQISTKLQFQFLELNAYKTFQFSSDKKHRTLLILTIITLLHTPFLTWVSTVFFMHLACISLLYNIPEKTIGKFPLPLRGIPVLKVFLIAYVWASISSFLPAITAHEPVLTQTHLLIFTAHFLFIIAITLPFDIRDFRVDHKNTLITFPQWIGIKRTKQLALVCLMVFSWIIWHITRQWPILVFSTLTALLIQNASPRKKAHYFTFYLDGTIILYFFTILLSLR